MTFVDNTHTVSFPVPTMKRDVNAAFWLLLERL
jgi:hypothetical protein